MDTKIDKFNMKVDDVLGSDKFLDRLVNEINKKVEGEKDTIKAILLHLLCSWVKNTVSLPHIFVNSKSSAGKSYICKQIVKIFPKEKVEYRTKITPEAFTYWHNSKYEPEWSWDGKICYLEDVKEDIINSATFKVMASEGSKATVVIKQRAVDIEIKGHPTIIVTAANVMPKTEIINRFSIINLDESPEQTKRIKRKQLEQAVMGSYEEYNPIFTEALDQLLRVEVRLPEWIMNIADHFPDDVIRVRRDFPRFLDMMKASAALHQKQREFDVLTKVVFANEKDYEIARKIMIKLDTSGGVFGLTYRLRKCYDDCLCFWKEKKTSFSAKEMFQFHPIVTERTWKIILDKLAGDNILNVELEERYWSKKHVTVFSPKSVVSLSLPSYESLIKDKKDRNDVKKYIVRNETNQETKQTKKKEKSSELKH